MAIQVALTHQTQYKYDKPVRLGPQVVRLRPAPHSRTPILSYTLKLSPAKHQIHWQQDPHGNLLARAVIADKTREFTIDVDLVAELSAVNPFDFFLEPGADQYPFEYPAEVAKDLEPYRTVEPSGQLLDAFLEEVSREPRSTVGFLVDLNSRVRNAVGYVTRFESGIQTTEETLQCRTGSCRDSAWLLVQVLRRLGLAARFVSGYLIQLAPDEGTPEETSKGDNADLHAWAEVFLPGAGWIGLDPTSGLLAGEGHIPLACTPHASNAAPITGTVGPANVEFTYSLTVRRVGESPRPSTAFSDESWVGVESLARKIDDDLSSMDVRLTMGGEPTFVGLDEPDSPQWNGDAMGPLKRDRAVSLMTRLSDQIASGALLHFGQGKWYPGEPLPRWALNCFWRSDGIPVWEKPDLIAKVDQDYGFTTADALQFIEALTRRLRVSTANVIPAFEDTFYYLWKERKLPVNVDTLDSKLANPREREELARVFERGLTKPVGYVLPIRRRQHQGKHYWSSQLWFLRPERLLLMQGDSPLGFRLPLDSLPWVTLDEIEYEYEADPFAKLEKLPPKPPRLLNLFHLDPPADPQPENAKTDPDKQATRPALCVEARAGRLHVFLPYITKLPDYLDLVAAIEDTCLHLQKPVWIEGYTPPSDARLRSFSITPDPGVIEVNLPPASNWDELQRINTVVFEEARENRLTAEKFANDGTHTSTGGGNHIVIGGPTPADSPLLRRPDLLRSMVSFWQHHPSLSYLFSGRFIGPTSQHPRVDEARMDALYELEIAFTQLPEGECPPWLVDRLFRNLLVDITGNTHRAEFCIDKLYPPQGSRLGLLELRAFEMAPSVRMGLSELLLIRGLVAMFWKKPYSGRLIRWGTSLHDRFLLPHYVQQDFSDVLATLQGSGYAFNNDWFRSQFEFRFPKIGSVTVSGIELELRQALEPWHVLGEESSSGGMSRGVDSSLERLQVKVSGVTSDSRYVVTCNGRKVPLRATGIPGEAVGGVRYRAWQPPSSLHPTIPVHTPLVFDIVDLWNERSLGGCTYHVVHPGGRWYASRPINAGEAESRRRERFQNFGHTPGPMAVAEEDRNPNFPMTLDLRWPTLERKEQPRRAARIPMISDLRQIPLTDRSVYDETSEDGVRPRDHWAPLFGALQALGPDELARRWSRAERRIRENGVTYNIYSDPLGASRPWQIDMIPMLLPAAEWRMIEAGLVQRAELLNLILEDLYGRRDLVKTGRLPPELLFANPAFLRPLSGLAVPRQSFLHLLAVDLARSPDGQWWILSQRAQTPSGAGYALENRTIVSEALPDVFRSSNVRRLAPFFRAQRDSLMDLAQCDNPRIVLLTPGMLNETYFEHSYLSRYLGFTLVEGADLTVRSRKVYLKTVHGLQRVDVIVRRVDDSFCDPLELRADSYLGVAGLVDAVAAGNVKIANALGSGVIETAAILPFLPGLSRHLLGEPIKLPSVATWWCGQDYALDWVLNNLDGIVVKPAFPSRGMEPVFGAELTKQEQQSFAAKLRSRPHEYVAQEQVALSRAPVWDQGNLHWRSIVLRTYVLNNGSGWTVMPGGLVRVAESDGPVVSMQRGGHSKDAWVLWDEPVDTFTMLRPRDEPVQLQHASVDLPSRVGDNLFWLGRYIERSENIARLLRTLVSRVRQTDHTEFSCLLRLYSCLDTRAAKLPKKKRPTAQELEDEILSLMADAERPDSLASTLSEVARVGGAVRERLSTDFSRLIGELAGSIKVEEYMLFVEYSALLTGCLELLSAVSGMERENITRGPGWLFMSFGRRLERAIYSARQMREITKPLEEEDWPLLEYLLEVADSSITYRRRYYTTLQPVAVLHILLADETNPRSLVFQLSHMADLYGKLPRHAPEDLKAMRRTLEFVQSFGFETLELPLPGAQLTRASSDKAARLSNWLKELETLLPVWSNNLSTRYFSHARTLPMTIGE